MQSLVIYFKGLCVLKCLMYLEENHWFFQKWKSLTLWEMYKFHVLKQNFMEYHFSSPPMHTAVLSINHVELILILHWMLQNIENYLILIV